VAQAGAGGGRGGEQQGERQQTAHGAGLTGVMGLFPFYPIAIGRQDARRASEGPLQEARRASEGPADAAGEDSLPERGPLSLVYLGGLYHGGPVSVQAFGQSRRSGQNRPKPAK
jgi:hypothetical protein